MYIPFIVIFTVTMLVAASIIFPRFGEKILLYVSCIIVIAVIIFGLCALQNAAKAENLDVKEGVITRVAPEVFNGYPILIITVETFDGQVYTYYAEDEIDVDGVVTLFLFGDEVIDVE